MWFHLYEMTRIGKCVETEATGLGVMGVMGSDCYKGHKVYFEGGENAQIVVIVSQLCDILKK